MAKSIDDIFCACLEKASQGESAEDILAQYPQYAQELKELLSIARVFESNGKVRPCEQAISFCLSESTAMARALKQNKIKNFSLDAFFSLPPALAKGLVFALLIMFLSWSTQGLYAYSLPGDFMYPVKIAGEKTQILLTLDREKKVNKRLLHCENRLKELIVTAQAKGILDETLLGAMLHMSSRALEDISVLPKTKKNDYYKKLAYVNACHKNALNSLIPKIDPAHRQPLQKAVSMCTNRTNWMQRMCRGEVPEDCWGPDCN